MHVHTWIQNSFEINRGVCCFRCWCDAHACFQLVKSLGYYKLLIWYQRGRIEKRLQPARCHFSPHGGMCFALDARCVHATPHPVIYSRERDYLAARIMFDGVREFIGGRSRARRLVTARRKDEAAAVPGTVRAFLMLRGVE